MSITTVASEPQVDYWTINKIDHPTVIELIMIMITHKLSKCIQLYLTMLLKALSMHFGIGYSSFIERTAFTFMRVKNTNSRVGNQ
jgi:hypothetical protein